MAYELERFLRWIYSGKLRVLISKNPSSLQQVGFTVFPRRRRKMQALTLLFSPLPHKVAVLFLWHCP